MNAADVPIALLAGMGIPIPNTWWGMLIFGVLSIGAVLVVARAVHRHRAPKRPAPEDRSPELRLRRDFTGWRKDEDAGLEAATPLRERVAELVQQLHGGDPATCRSIVGDLQGIGPEAVPLLERALSVADPDVRADLAKALRRIHADSGK